MRILPIFALAAASIALPAAAQNPAPAASPNGKAMPQQHENLSSGGSVAGGCGKQAAWTEQMNQKLAQNGYTGAQQVPQALVVHAIGPDGIPVVLLIAPSQSPQ